MEQFDSYFVLGFGIVTSTRAVIPKSRTQNGKHHVSSEKED
jgi:hypothetical protein